MALLIIDRLRPVSATVRAAALLALLVAVLLVATGGGSLQLILDNARQAAPLGIIALGQALILMMGRLDLSVGAAAGLANVVLASAFAGNPANLAPALALTLGLGLAVGLANGLLVVALRIPAFLATLATAMVIAGGILVTTGGSPRGSIPASFRVITEGWIGGVMPWSVVIWLIVGVALMVFVHFTLAGRRMLIAGANARAARHSGIAAGPLVVASFVVSALMATLGGILLSAITGMASIGIADSYAVDSIAAAVIGGAVFSGGVFLPAGAACGALIIFLLQSLLYVLSLPPAARFIVQGAIIVFALALANYRKEG
ncbi:MAG: ABC transporter permease [Ancalomicrobiaceae bacterium]|nr:ABC transporter permease [Ancalomicrobiaceae bacterium]